MNKNIVYACLLLILFMTSSMLYIYSETKKISTTNSKLTDFATYISSSTITIMIITCSIMSMFYQITNDLNLPISSYNNNSDDNSDDNNSNDDCDDGNCDDD